MSQGVPLGQIVVTQGILQWMAPDIRRGRWVSDILHRHQQGDWGDVGAEDRRTNDRARRRGGRLFSVYHYEDGTTVWVITEADRSATAVLMPDEY